MQARRIWYDVISLARRDDAAHSTPSVTVYEHRLVRTAYNNPNRTFAIKKCGSIPGLTIFVVCAPTLNSDEEEVEAFFIDLQRFCREDHTFFKVIIGDFNAKIGPRRTPEKRHIGTHGIELNEQGEWLSQFIMVSKTICPNHISRSPTLNTGRGSLPLECTITK
uniref:Endo/exonuclease/phosphatase domain-containing protein n=1 Tax=Angiostrongylus cantonensis TaxID=6313 RepID=A0A0K0DR58_ANGCA